MKKINCLVASILPNFWIYHQHLNGLSDPISIHLQSKRVRSRWVFFVFYFIWKERKKQPDVCARRGAILTGCFSAAMDQDWGLKCPTRERERKRLHLHSDERPDAEWGKNLTWEPLFLPRQRHPEHEMIDGKLQSMKWLMGSRSNDGTRMWWLRYPRMQGGAQTNFCTQAE